MRWPVSLLLLAVLGSIVWATVTASVVEGEVVAAAAELWADPWGRATLIDTYGAFTIGWLWIAARERSWAVRLGWLVLVYGLGSIALSIYFLIALARLPEGGDWRDLLSGREETT